MGTDIFEIMHSTRAMRRLKPDPVPDALVRRILEAATAAPNPSNQQRWRFLVVKDPVTKAQVQRYYAQAWGFLSPADVALGMAGLTLIAEVEVPTFADSVVALLPMSPTQGPLP